MSGECDKCGEHVLECICGPVRIQPPKNAKRFYGKATHQTVVKYIGSHRVLFRHRGEMTVDKFVSHFKIDLNFMIDFVSMFPVELQPYVELYLRKDEFCSVCKNERVACSC